MESVIRNFNENGFAILRRVLEPGTREAVKHECEVLVAELAVHRYAAGKLTDTYPDAAFDTRLLRLYENYPDETPTIFRSELHREGFFSVFAHRTLLELAGILLGPEIRLYPNYSVRPKLPENKRTEVLWHQDAGYTSKEADVLRMMNVWTPLVPVNVENGCMEFIPGSHKWVLFHTKKTNTICVSTMIISNRLNRMPSVLRFCRGMSPFSVIFCSIAGYRTALHTSDGV